MREVRRTWAQSRVIVARIRGIFDSVDALLVPVAPVSAVAHDRRLSSFNTAGSKALDLMAQCRAISSLTGLKPALAVPTIRTEGGRTVSVQVVGPPGADQLCCEIGQELVAAL